MIKLFNRDKADLFLENKNDDIWELKVDDKHSYIFKYMRVGYNKDKIIMIDPSGGPYLEVGGQIENFKIVEILNYKTLRLEKNIH